MSGELLHGLQLSIGLGCLSIAIAIGFGSFSIAMSINSLKQSYEDEREILKSINKFKLGWKTLGEKARFVDMFEGTGTNGIRTTEANQSDKRACLW